MTEIDYIVFGILFLCLVVSLTRGVIAEVVSLLKWVLAFFASKLGYQFLSETFFRNFLSTVFLADTVSFLSIFLFCFIVLHFLKESLTRFVRVIGLNSINRLLGGVLGVLKGTMIITLLVMLVSLTDFKTTDSWTNSISIPYFEALAQWIIPYLNQGWNEFIKN